MDGFSRRAFCTLLAAWAGPSSARLPREQFVAQQDGQRAAETVVTTRGELESAFENLSPGETIRISGANAPYRTTRWLDIDADGVSVIGPGVQRLIQPADGANVGGFRIGQHSRCHEIDIHGVGFHGNPAGQRDDVSRLHGIAVRNATNVTVRSSLIRQTHPVRHGDGGSGISVTRECSDVRIFDTKIDRFGDRGIQLGGERHMVYGNVITNGLDRPIACDLWPSAEENQTAESVSISGNLLGNSFEGSLVGVARNTPLPENGYVSVVGNVGFGSHKSFCHVRGPEAQRNISIQNNVSTQDTTELQTDNTTKFAGIAVDVAEGRTLAIKNNELYDYSGHGIHVDSNISDITLQDNGIFGAELAGIRLEDGANALVDDNLIADVGEAGIRLKGASDSVVRGNYIRQVDTAGIVTGDGPASAGHDIVNNYVTATNRRNGSFPGILVRDSGVRVRGNTIRESGAAAIAEPGGVQGNVYAANYADGDDPWQLESPASRIRDHVPPIDVHRDVSTEPGSNVVRVEFDRAYARRPQLTFGRIGGAVQKISFHADNDGSYVGAELTIDGDAAEFDIAVNEL